MGRLPGERGARRRKAARAMKREGQACGPRLAEMAK